MRVPCIMRWPGKIPSGKICSEIAATIDVMPTLAALAGATVPDDRVIDGKNILPLMMGKDGATSPHEAYYYYRGTTLQAVRSGKWKLRLEKKKTELFDLESDIGESKNVAAKHADIVSKLTTQLKEFDGELKANARPAGKTK